MLGMLLMIFKPSTLWLFFCPVLALEDAACLTASKGWVLLEMSDKSSDLSWFITIDHHLPCWPWKFSFFPCFSKCFQFSQIQLCASHFPVRFPTSQSSAGASTGGTSWRCHGLRFFLHNALKNILDFILKTSLCQTSWSSSCSPCVHHNRLR